jgi:2-polyprenyl-3-methyl-5-hydroxy-6-metoxy-1,4-benzoquinol methylase
MNNCIVCNSTKAEPFYPGILKCQQCGHVVADLLLSDQELFELYKKDYFFGDEYSDYVADKKIIQKNFKLRLKTLKTFIKPTVHSKLLEIGCAYGFFLDIAQSRFNQVQGIDITADGIRYAREVLKLDVLQGDLLKHDFGAQKFDVVCMWDTIEHLRQPEQYIEKISKSMESGALLAITTGDIGSLNARLRQEKWRLIHPPTHIHYFSKQSLANMLNNYGFDVVYNQYCGFYRSIDNIAYNIFVLRHKQPKLYKLLKSLRLTELDFYLNLYDIMYVIARKR